MTSPPVAPLPGNPPPAKTTPAGQDDEAACPPGAAGDRAPGNGSAGNSVTCAPVGGRTRIDAPAGDLPDAGAAGYLDHQFCTFSRPPCRQRHARSTCGPDP